MSRVLVLQIHPKHGSVCWCRDDQTVDKVTRDRNAEEERSLNGLFEHKYIYIHRVTNRNNQFIPFLFFPFLSFRHAKYITTRTPLPAALLTGQVGN